MIDMHKNKSEKSCIVAGMLIGITVGILVCNETSRGGLDE